MANLAANNSPKPLSAPGGSVQLTSGVAPGQTLHKLFLNVTTTGTASITTLDGTTVSLGSLPVGVYIFDCQFQSVTLGTAVATMVGFYRIDG